MARLGSFLPLGAALLLLRALPSFVAPQQGVSRRGVQMRGFKDDFYAWRLGPKTAFRSSRSAPWSHF